MRYAHSCDLFKNKDYMPSPIYVNPNGVPLAVAVFLASDNYEYVDDPFTISVTTLMRPVRQIILATRAASNQGMVNIEANIKSSIGAAIHDAIEKSWVHDYEKSLSLLGYPKGMIKKIKINPKPEDLTSDCIPIYLEQRVSRKVGKWTVTGKYDFVGEGIVQDFKTTSTYTYTKQSNADKYPLQGSLYRWLNPSIIIEDYMLIHYIFTDWKPGLAKSDTYPPKAIHSQKYLLSSLNETEQYVRNKLGQLEQYANAPEEEIPLCADDDLWRSDPIFKYYRNPDKMTRSTKNFDSLHEAQVFKAENSHMGIIVEKPGQVKACAYCSAFYMCKQKDALIASGDLIL